MLQVNPSPWIYFLLSLLISRYNLTFKDPLCVLSGNIPNWLTELATICPFIIPFDLRRFLFYISNFDRQRAIQKLLERLPEYEASWLVLEDSAVVYQVIIQSKIVELQGWNYTQKWNIIFVDWFPQVSKSKQNVIWIWWYCPDNYHVMNTYLED